MSYLRGKAAPPIRTHYTRLILMDSLSETLIALSKSTHGRMPTELRGLGALRSYARLATCSTDSAAADNTALGVGVNA